MTGSTHRRSTRDWIVDSITFVLAVLLGLYTYSEGEHDPVNQTLLALDLLSGMALCLTLWFRRRWPVQLALVAAVVSTFSDTAGVATLLLMLTALHPFPSPTGADAQGPGRSSGDGCAVAGAAGADAGSGGDRPGDA